MGHIQRKSHHCFFHPVPPNKNSNKRGRENDTKPHTLHDCFYGKSRKSHDWRCESPMKQIGLFSMCPWLVSIYPLNNQPTKHLVSTLIPSKSVISWIPGQPHPRFYFSFITLLSSRPLSKVCLFYQLAWYTPFTNHLLSWMILQVSNTPFHFWGIPGIPRHPVILSENGWGVLPHLQNAYSIWGFMKPFLSFGGRHRIPKEICTIFP